MKYSAFILCTLFALVACSDDNQSVSPVVVAPTPVSYSSMGTLFLTSRDYPFYDITQFVPYTVESQLRLFHRIHRFYENIFDVKTLQIINQECLEQNSFAQTAYAMALQKKENFTKAKEYYLKAAEKGNAYAENRLGEMYLLGLGVEVDKKQARYWFERSANKGYYFAESALGMMELDIQNFKKFLPDRYAGLFFSAQEMATTSIGKNANLQQAKYWLTRASLQGDYPSLNAMNHFKLELADIGADKKTPIEIIPLNPNICLKKHMHQTNSIPDKFLVDMNFLTRYQLFPIERNEKREFYFKNANEHGYPIHYSETSLIQVEKFKRNP